MLVLVGDYMRSFTIILRNSQTVYQRVLATKSLEPSMTEAVSRKFLRRLGVQGGRCRLLFVRGKMKIAHALIGNLLAKKFAAKTHAVNKRAWNTRLGTPNHQSVLFAHGRLYQTCFMIEVGRTPTKTLVISPPWGPWSKSVRKLPAANNPPNPQDTNTHTHTHTQGAQFETPPETGNGNAGRVVSESGSQFCIDACRRPTTS